MSAPEPRPTLSTRAAYAPPLSPAPRPPSDPLVAAALPLLAGVFVLSGAAGLMYESIWSRYLGLFVGHSAYAQIIVLVIFLGGMSIGAFAVGQRSAALRRPLYWYAVVEFAVGVIGFAFHDLFAAVVGAAYDRWFPALSGGPLLIVVKWGLAGLLILPQSILLGATFPLMSAGAIRLRTARDGHVLGLLYFANSLGAAAGVLVAGFVLISWFGLPGTLLTAAILNFAAALVVIVLVRAGLAEDPDAAEPAPAPTAPAALRPLSRVLLLVSFGTALSSFIYEIGWIRMLSLVLGSATHSFELMLSAFILGLALGAFWVRRRADSFRDPVRALGVVQWAMGVLAIATLPIYVLSFRWTATLLETFNKSDSGYHGFILARYAICLLVMVPATFCAGMTLPLITQMLLRAGEGERAIGAVYGVNTLGSIVGVVLAGLVLMPVLGLKPLLVSGAVIDIVIGALLIAYGEHRRRGVPRRTLVAVSGTAAVVALTAAFVRFDPSVLSSGVYRHAILSAPGSHVFPFWRDGRTATVTVRRVADDSDGVLTLATNGKPDASVDAVWRRPFDPGAPPAVLGGDLSTQVLLPIITLAHAPLAREAAVIGEGSGMTSHFLLGSPRIRRLSTIEIEPEMIHGSRIFYPANRRVFDDPRSAFIIDDAKSFFAASGRRFDLILSEPSNPWVSGVSGLFTAEFYGLVKRHLGADGVFGQWLHLYEIEDPLVSSVLAAIDQTFPAYEIFLTSNADLLVVASNRASLPAPDWTVVRLPGVAEDLRRVVPLTPASLEAMRLANRDVLHPYLAIESTPNSDYYPILDLGTERTRFLHIQADGMISLGEGRFDIVAALTGRGQPLGPPIDAPAAEIERVKALALGSRLRALWRVAPQPSDTAYHNKAFRTALYHMRRLEQELGASAPPADWQAWTEDLRSVESDLYSGTAGVADERFYGDVRAYMARANAPAEALASVHLLHGVAAWEWEEVAQSGDALIAALRAGRAWLPLQLLREASVVAKLRQRNPAGAQAAFRALAPFAESGTAFRDRVLGAITLRDSREQKKK